MSRLFGEIRQNGYVVRDLEAALRHWVEVLGVGPWFHFARAPITEFRYRGVASPATVAIALANSGPLQIELIQPLDDAPSMYADFLRAGLEGLQHVACWTEHFDAELARAEARGYRIGQSGCAGGPDGRFVYFDTGGHPGTVLELSEISGPKGAFFAHIRKAAQDWDGRDPIRRLGR
jgi:catechol 2,3-dioxygenase-like lactoylglutathione lyase family enzyme